MKNILIVESPAKARKIQGFFKDGTKVISSFGHIYDLPKESMSIDIENNFKPNYRPIDGKNKIIKEIRNYSKNYNILLAADDDREGDSIAWHCGKVANLSFNLKNRIIFHEITKSAIDKSMEEIHKLNMNSVNAQQARRIIDRLVGYNLSPLLWKHIPTKEKGLSAGRVQSTMLLLLKEVEDEINNYTPTYSYEYIGKFKDKPNCNLVLFDKDKDKFEVLNALKQNRNFKIQTQSYKKEKKYPPIPFITSSLQQCALNELGYSVKQTMSIAQKLYENGLITYMRTDSTNISQEFKLKLKEHISNKYGREYYDTKETTTKKIKGAQEAHECIRVTNLQQGISDSYSEYDIKLYKLILKRTIISHMKPAIYGVLSYELSNKEIEKIGIFSGKYKMLLYDGYLCYSNNHEIQKETTKLPNEIYNLLECICEYKESSSPQYYNEASIVKKLEKTGIGRPSTYASLISTILNRKYTEKITIKGKEKSKYTVTLTKENTISEKSEKVKSNDMKNKIILTDLGREVLKYLMEHFSILINVQFTSNVENDLDKINKGEVDWIDVIRKVYNSFIDIVNIQKSITSSQIKEYRTNNAKKLGVLKNKEVYLQKGKYGPYITFGEKRISIDNYLKHNKISYSKINLKNIQEFLEYPKIIGNYKNSEIKILYGPYGKYMKYQNKNYRIPQDIEYSVKTCSNYLPD